MKVPNALDECPDVTTGDLEALVSAFTRTIGATIHGTGYTVGTIDGLTNGATQAAGDILKGLLKGDNLLKSVDDGLEGFKNGFTDAFINTLSKYQNVPL